MRESDLVGTWELVRRESTGDGNGVADPWASKQVGRLIFTADGWVAGFIEMPNRASFKGGDPFGGTSDEMADAGQGWLSYCGRYSLQNDVVTMHYQVSFFPNWEGIAHRRYVQLDGDILTVTTDPIVSQGIARVTTLVWRRTEST